MKFCRGILTIAACLAVTASAFGTIRNVPAQYTKIQLAINAAVNGDTVIIADGHYYERISFAGKAIKVGSRFLVDGSTSHISATIIDADPAVLGVADTGSVVRFHNWETSESVLSGVTLQKGTGIPIEVPGLGIHTAGGGIFCRLADPSIEHCRIMSCTAEYGSGIASYQGSTLVVRACDVQGELAVLDGTMLLLRDTSTAGSVKIIEYGNFIIGRSTVENITVSGSSYTWLGRGAEATSVTVIDSSILEIDSATVTGTVTMRGDSRGRAMTSTLGGIEVDSCLEVIDFDVDNCLITGPSSAIQGGIEFSQSTLLGGITCGDGTVVLDSSIVYLSSGGYVISCAETTFCAVIAICSDFYGYTGPDWFECANLLIQTDDLMRVNPSFCDPAGGDYHLADSSVCAPTRNACQTQIGLYPVGCGCCVGTTGNVNASGGIDLSDLSLLIAYMTVTPKPALSCQKEANVNGLALIDLSDLSLLIAYLTVTPKPLLPNCY